MPKNLERDIRSMMSSIGSNISEKFKNINGKTAKNNVPNHLWQKRTHRKNRVLISWKSVHRNELNFDQLETFDGGIVVEFVNDDFFNPLYSENDVYKELKNRVGSDENVSSIISFRVEEGDSGANVARESYAKFQKMFPDFTLSPIVRKEGSFRNKGMGNDKWEGNSYIFIQGGQQQSINSHDHFEQNLGFKNPRLFNPANEFANEEVRKDLYISLTYFFLHCHDINHYVESAQLQNLKEGCESYLNSRNYDHVNLLEYCINHPSIAWEKGVLMDPIAVERLNVLDFDVKWDFENPLCIAICHNQPVNKDNFVYDYKNNCILTPAQPTNVFWGKQSSNMIQQSHKLDDYFRLEEARVEKRRPYLS